MDIPEGMSAVAFKVAIMGILMAIWWATEAVPIAVTANQNLDQFTSSRSLQNQFKRTISRLYELTSKNYK